MNDLNNNPLSLIRNLPTEMIKSEDLKQPDNIEIDQILLKKYKNYLTGKAKAYATRISISNIKCGFYKNTNDGLIYILYDINKDVVEALKKIIRSGSRPSLHIYLNINKNDKEKFLCPDDLHTYLAYLELKIKKPPVLILSSRKYIEESCYEIISLKNADGSFTPRFYGALETNSELIPLLLSNSDLSYNLSLEKLIDSVKFVKNKLKEFHSNGIDAHHYHHTLYSILQRAEDTLVSIKILYEKKLYLNASVLVRTLYELALTFYIDWLSPEYFHEYLKISSMIKEKEWSEMCDKEIKENIQNGLKKSEAMLIKKSHTKGFHLASTVSEKARIFPFGEKFYKEVYSFLSKIAHHDFSMVARYRATLERNDDDIFNEDIIKKTIDYSDMFISHIVVNILDDIG